MKRYPLQGEYPAVPGNKLWSIAELTGPESYTQVTPGTPPTGGQEILASAFGLKFLEHVWVSMVDRTGAYIAHPISPASPGQPATSVTVVWIVAAGGAEVAGAVDLSGTTVRIMALGY